MKSKTKIKKRVRPNAQERELRRIARHHSDILKTVPDKRTASDRAFLEYISSCQDPYRQRGDHYFQIITALQSVDDSFMGELNELPDKIAAITEHLGALLADKLNYDDMREALMQCKGIIEDKDPVKQLFEACPEFYEKICNALTGAPASDLGRMRSALKLADVNLSDAVKIMDERAPREAVMWIWDVIREARRALKAAPAPDKLEKMRDENLHLVKMIVAAGEIAGVQPEDNFDSLPDKVKQVVEERDAYRRVTTRVHTALVAFDPEFAAIGGTVGERAEEIIHEAISLRAFLVEAEAKLAELRSANTTRQQDIDLIAREARDEIEASFSPDMGSGELEAIIRKHLLRFAKQDSGIPEGEEEATAVLQKALRWLLGAEHQSRSCHQPFSAGWTPCVCGLREVRDSLQKLLSLDPNAAHPLPVSQKPSNAEIAQFLKEFDEGKHPLSDADKAALDASRPELFRRVKTILSSQESGAESFTFEDHCAMMDAKCNGWRNPVEASFRIEGSWPPVKIAKEFWEAAFASVKLAESGAEKWTVESPKRMTHFVLLPDGTRVGPERYATHFIQLVAVHNASLSSPPKKN